MPSYSCKCGGLVDYGIAAEEMECPKCGKISALKVKLFTPMFWGMLIGCLLLFNGLLIGPPLVDYVTHGFSDKHWDYDVWWEVRVRALIVNGAIGLVAIVTLLFRWGANRARK